MMVPPHLLQHPHGDNSLQTSLANTVDNSQVIQDIQKHQLPQIKPQIDMPRPKVLINSNRGKEGVEILDSDEIHVEVGIGHITASNGKE